MSLPLSPEILAAQYEALRICPPFVRWKLPPSEDITFCVIRHKDREGDYTRIIGTDNHFIRISETRIGHYDSFGVVMAHEMIHLLQAVKKLETKAAHNADFRRRAASVCRTLGFDPKTFC